MCRIDGTETVEIFHSANRRARKPYKCIECGRSIVIGETYHYEFGTLEGFAETYRTCSHCMVAREWLRVNCGGWIYSDVIDEIREHAEEYHKIALPLLRLVVGAKRKWRSFAGGVSKLPKLPPPLEAAM